MYCIYICRGRFVEIQHDFVFQNWMLFPMSHCLVWESPAALRHLSEVNEDVSIAISYQIQIEENIYEEPEQTL